MTDEDVNPKEMCVILSTKADAEKVVRELRSVLSKYEWVSFGDLKILVGISTTYIDERLGWKSLEKFKICQLKEGWALFYPELEKIELTCYERNSSNV